MDYQELDLDEIAYVPPEMVVDTGGLGPCLGIFVYDRRGRQAYGAHFVGVSHQTERLEGMVDDAIAEFGNVGDLEVYATGNSEDEDSMEEHDFIEGYLPELLERKGFSSEKVYFRSTPTRTVTNLVLNTDTGDVSVGVTRYSSEGETGLYVGDFKALPDFR